ncbi:MAG: hypothetical protein ACLRZH_01390 [Ruthenibacterium lactatiformans]
MVTAKEETAALLNEYFRPADDPIAAADIGTRNGPPQAVRQAPR